MTGTQGMDCVPGELVPSLHRPATSLTLECLEGQPRRASGAGLTRQRCVTFRDQKEADARGAQRNGFGERDGGKLRRNVQATVTHLP